VDRQIREVRGRCADRAPGALGYEDEGSAGEAARPAVDAHLPRARDADEEYVYLVVHVLPDPFALGEPDQVDVEIAAPLEAPDNACPVLGGGQYLYDLYVIFRWQSRSRSSIGSGSEEYTRKVERLQRRSDTPADLILHPVLPSAHLRRVHQRRFLYQHYYYRISDHSQFVSAAVGTGIGQDKPRKYTMDARF
jgi:hypothetical protein